jgi:asparagine synthase (glutamine-hydrolysing)
MCGLILAPSGFPIDRIEKAMDVMGYRGADGLKGISQGFGWTLGHVRLAIQDRTDEGNQPFCSGRSMTAFVGELFNHGGAGEKAYLSQLLATEDFHGVDGFWSIVHVMETGARVYTDFLGTKPLYWWPEQGIVCSELDPMFQLVNRPAFDEIYLANCIKFGYDYSGRTPYQGIRQLDPGSRLFLDRGGENVSMRAYWDWNKVSVDPALDLREVIDQAIRRRLLGDRPVAMLLSGGLDSSIIYYSLKKMGWEVKTFSVENGESEFLPEGTTPLSIVDTAFYDLDEAAEIMQAPLDLGSLIPQIQLAEAVAREGFHVVMTGDGADELFGGYRRATQYDSQQSDIFCELPFYHLPRLDRVMMRSTIELRTPFLAPSVISMALRTPRALRTSKQALKLAYSDIVPRPILERAKHPLKTQAVINGGETYRQQLVKEFRNVSAYI